MSDAKNQTNLLPNGPQRPLVLENARIVDPSRDLDANGTVIITDGRENSIVVYDRTKVFKMIRAHEKKHNWKFIFMGTNQDAIAEARDIGIVSQRAIHYGAAHFRSSSAVLGPARLLTPSGRCAILCPDGHQG